MSIIGKIMQDNAVEPIRRTQIVDSNFDDDERLERSLLDACIMAENVNKQMISNEDVNKGNESDTLNNKGRYANRICDDSAVKCMSIKKDFDRPPERFVEPNMDYSLDDVIEIHSISDEEDNDSEQDVVCLDADDRAADQVESLSNDFDDNEGLLNVFNDHNYMSQESATITADLNNDLRQNIIDHIVKKRSLESNNNGTCGIYDGEESQNSSNDSSIDENVKKEIEDFVDQILDGKIDNFVKKEIKNEAIHTEDFIQNVINAVADEDAQEYAAEHSLYNRKLKDADNKISIDKTVHTGSKEIAANSSNINVESDSMGVENQDGIETCSFRKSTELGAEKLTDNCISELNQNEFDTQNCQLSTNASSHINSESTNNEKDQLDSNTSLPEYCSEPLEILPLDERFDMAIEEEIEIPFGEDVERNEATFLDNLLEQFENDAQQFEMPSEDDLPQTKANMEAPVETEETIPESLVNDVLDVRTAEKATCEETQQENEVLGTSPQGQDNLSSVATVVEKNAQKTTLEDKQTSDNTSEFSSESNIGKSVREAERLCPQSLILQEFAVLVRQMQVDCEKFSEAATNIDSRIGSYILDKLEIMHSLSRRCGTTSAYVERGTQTVKEPSINRLRKLNKKNKRALLASTDSSSCISSSSSDEHLSSSCDEMDTSAKSLRKPEILPTCKTSDETPEAETAQSGTDPEALSSLQQQSQGCASNSEGVYDDGVVLTKYLQSNVFSAPNTEMEDNKTANTSTSPRIQSRSSSISDEDNTNSKAQSSLDKKNEKHVANKKGVADENDKEIERLINLDGLMKRHNNFRTSKQSDVDKQKTKSQNQKTKVDGVLEFLENDSAKDSLSSEESAIENEKEVITEKQYLERFNQDLKKQLLNDSSNEASHSEETDDEFPTVLSDESEGGNRSPLVDKFLKTYNIDESEEEDVEPAEDIPDKDTPVAISKSVEAKKTEDDQTSLKKDENQEKINEKHVSDNSDGELLNDNFICRKRSQPRSLEKILSEAEKRKKIQKLDEDLISLSSESDSSDVEAVDIEQAELAKSRTIKPMLRPDQLQRETLKAQKNEAERIRRLEKKQTMLNKVLAENKDLNTDEELVLDYNDETKTFVKVHSELVKHLKPHQRDGVRFMYDSCYGGIDTGKKSNGSGCILAHCMGLGKTLQLITLMHTVISYKELKTHKILVLCPKSTVMNWGDEIARWLHPLRTKNLKVYTFNDTSDIYEKINIMRDWSQSSYQKAGCLLIGYEAFRTLVFYHTYKNRNNLDPARLEQIRNLIGEYLLQPGADLVVCDEGHIIKNSKSAISLAVAEIKTQKRIVLTGTPIQNNLKEYYSMVNFIKPLFLGTEKEFANLYANPIKNGQHKDSSKRDIKVMKQRSFVLHKKLSKFVQRKEAELLKSFLPKKFEYVLFIPMTNVQNKLYERILEAIKSRQDNRGRGLITDYTCLRKIWTHPKVLEDAWKNAINQKFKRDARKQANSDDDQPDDIYDSQTGFMSVNNDWWRNLINEKDLESILPSNKLRTMFEVLRMCEENGDKCLIFSAFVAVLNVVEYFFKKLAEGNKETLAELNMPLGSRSMWEPNKDYFRLDGKTPKSTRHEMIKRFNHPNNTRARVFLISAKAGGQGINLIGANRVIILDTSWNPSNDQQNIFRIFRLGQKKNCYIYRLLALGTMEEKVYSRSVTKQAMSFRVMDVQQIDRHYSMSELAELYTLTIPNYAERPTPIFPQDIILANLLRSYPDLVYKYHEHDSLLENKVEQELSEQEKIDAWNAYENDLQMNSQMANVEEMQNKLAQGNFNNYMGAGGMVPGLNLQALLGFHNMNAQTSTPYIPPSLLQHYKYNMASQPYLDLINNYRQYSTPEGAAAFTASVAAAYSSMNSGLYPGATPSISPHLPNNTNLSANSASHPLSALNDLSMFGMGINSSTSAAAAAAAAVGSNLAQLPSPYTNNSLYTTSAIPPQSVSAAGLYANQTASSYQALQQLGYVGTPPGNNNVLSNSALNTFTNNTTPFQAPRQTQSQSQSQSQSASRKSSTPDFSYRNSGGNMSMSTATTTTTASPLSTTSSMPMSTKSHELPKSSNLNNSANNSVSQTASNTKVNRTNNLDSMNLASRTIDIPSNKATIKPTSTSTPTSSNSTINNSNKNSKTRTETTTTPVSLPTATTKAKTSTVASKNLSSKNSLKPPPNNTNTAPATKATDSQIRVKDMGQLCGNTTRNTNSSLQAAAAAVVRDSPTNNFASNSCANAAGRNKHSSVDRKVSTPTPVSATDLLKARSEMQIIPTTSPPGTASISKQLSEISPSISLTAVRQTNVKPNNSNNSSSKTSGPNTTPINNNKSNLVNSPAPITPSILTNRQQSAVSIVQSKKNATNMNAIAINNSNLAVNTKKTAVSNASIVTSSPAAGSATKKALVSMSQSLPMLPPVSVKSLNTSNTGNKVTTTANSKNISNNNLVTNAPILTRVTTSAVGKTTANILRTHQIRKMPLSVPTSTVSTNNVVTNTIIRTSPSNSQPSSIVNTKSTLVNNTKTVVAANVANAAQLLYNNKINTSAKRSYSPTTTNIITQRTSRTASPVNSSAVFIEKVVSNNNNFNKVNTTTIATPITSAGTLAFPVHLQRTNSALGTKRTLSPLTTIKTSTTGLINRTKTSPAIITPRIASVTSLSTSTPSSVIPAATVAAIRTATLGRNTGKINQPTVKQVQPSTALKVAAATSVVQQKRLNTNGTVGLIATTAQPQQQTQQLQKQRAIIQSNGRSLSLNVTPTKTLSGETRIGAVNIRPILKGVTSSTNSGSTPPNTDKRTVVNPQVSSVQAVEKQLLERKRKASEIVYKEGGGLSKRPKDS